MVYVLLFIIGSAAGSFLNVCIYRMPREEKIGMTRSRCPHCKTTIRWYDNIPFISYILLGAKCRYCKKPISFRYFLVELLTAVFLCLLWRQFNPIVTVIYFIFISLLIIGSFIDIDFLIIPDTINFPGIILGLVACTLYPKLIGQYLWWKGSLRSLIGILIGGGSLYLIAVTASFVLKKEAMGMGDVKLLAMIGSFLGWQWCFFTILISSLLGSIAGVTLIVLGKTDIKGKIPFGPYLAMGAVVSLFLGKNIISWYTNLIWR